MPLIQSSYEHITFNNEGIPVISGTTMKVIELVVEKTAHGWSAEELHLNHPHVTLGQIYSALAYYSDHQDELDKDIDSRLRKIDEIQSASTSSTLKEKLKSKGLL